MKGKITKVHGFSHIFLEKDGMYAILLRLNGRKLKTLGNTPSVFRKRHQLFF